MLWRPRPLPVALFEKLSHYAISPLPRVNDVPPLRGGQSYLVSILPLFSGEHVQTPKKTSKHGEIAVQADCYKAGMSEKVTFQVFRIYVLFNCKK